MPRKPQPEAHTIVAGDGLRLEAERVFPAEARARVLLVHGYAEHQGRYRHVVDRLAGAACDVWSFDLRGHGRSGGRRGFVDRFEDYLDDVDTVLSHIESQTRLASTPILLLGHSLGGLIVLVHALTRVSTAAGLALSSPFLAPVVSLPRGAGCLAQLAGWLAPRRDLWLSLDPKDISRDPAVLEAHRNDPLVFTTVNVRWAAEVFKAQSRLLEAAPRLELPVLFMLAGDDRIADTPASLRVFERLGSEDRTVEVYPDLFHEIFNESERQRVLDDLVAWIGSHSRPAAG